MAIAKGKFPFTAGRTLSSLKDAVKSDPRPYKDLCCGSGLSSIDNVLKIGISLLN